MNLQNLLNQFTGSQLNGSSPASKTKSSGLGSGLMGGAAAGGIMALLAGNKSARKFAGKAATVGGAALIGGIAFKAYKNWQQNNQTQQSNAQPMHYAGDQAITTDMSQDFQLTLIKAMIGAAKADGHIDETEQKRIFDAVQQMNLSSEVKGLVFDLLRQPIYVEELAHGAHNMEQKSEVYLASCLAIDLDNPAEYNYLESLERVLNLPQGLSEQIRVQAKNALLENNQLN